MALVINDRVKETTTTTGTGAVSLAGAVTGFEAFSAGVGNSNTTYYTIAHQTANEWESFLIQPLTTLKFEFERQLKNEESRRMGNVT